MKFKSKLPSILLIVLLLANFCRCLPASSETMYDDHYDDQGNYDDYDENSGSVEHKVEELDENKTYQDRIRDEDAVNEEYSEEKDSDNFEVHLEKFCPRNCTCERGNEASLVAKCSELNLETQSFSRLPVTSLEVVDVAPKFPIVMGVNFFKKLGLSNLVSIKIENTSIEYISPSSFSDLNELSSVNLKNNRIDYLHQFTFGNNSKLKILALSGNNMQKLQQINMIVQPSLQELDLSNCNLTELFSTTFSRINNITYLNMAKNSLATLPRVIFRQNSNLKEINLSENLIKNLPENLFNYTSLTILNLQHNQIDSNLNFLPKSLQKLDLSHNKITKIAENSFKDIEKLEILNLKGNFITEINPNAFETNKNLRDIDLSFNNLESISQFLFFENFNIEFIRINNNGHLKSLPGPGFKAKTSFNRLVLFDASNCGLSALYDVTFQKMTKIKHLYLSGNNLKDLPEELFTLLNELEDLDLSRNLLTSLDPRIFSNNQNLMKLNLNSNSQIKKLSAETFQYLTNLEELDVSECNLVSIWTESSKETILSDDFLENLKIFNLSQNKIKKIFRSDLQILVNLNVFDIKMNPLRCDDNFSNMIKFLKMKNISLENQKDQENLNEIKKNSSEVDLETIWNEFSQQICENENEDEEDDDYNLSSEEKDEESSEDTQLISSTTSEYGTDDNEYGEDYGEPKTEYTDTTEQSVGFNNSKSSDRGSGAPSKEEDIKNDFHENHSEENSSEPAPENPESNDNPDDDLDGNELEEVEADDATNFKLKTILLVVSVFLSIQL